jgi:hypothetical protein
MGYVSSCAASSELLDYSHKGGEYPAKNINSILINETCLHLLLVWKFRIRGKHNAFATTDNVTKMQFRYL